LDYELLQLQCSELDIELTKTQEELRLVQARQQELLLHLECTENRLQYWKGKVGQVLMMLKESVKKYEVLIEGLDGQFSF